MVSATRHANELNMLAWAVHLLKMHCCNVTRSNPAAHGPLLVGHSPGETRVAESPSRQVADLSRVAESLVAAPRLGAPRPTLSPWACAGGGGQRRERRGGAPGGLTGARCGATGERGGRDRDPTVSVVSIQSLFSSSLRHLQDEIEKDVKGKDHKLSVIA